MRGLTSFNRQLSSAPATDIVFVQNLKVDAVTGRDFWQRPVSQPLSLTLSLGADLRESGRTDDLRYSLNYAVVSNKILDFFRNTKENFRSIEKVGQTTLDIAFKTCHTDVAKVSVESTKSEIRCRSVQVELERQRGLKPVAKDVVLVNELQLLTIIGVFTFERLQRQIVKLNLKLEYGAPLTQVKPKYFESIQEVTKYVETANFKTVEALVHNVSSLVLEGDENVEVCTVEVVKPNAILESDGVGCSITRTRAEISPVVRPQADASSQAFSIPNLNSATEFAESDTHVAYIAFGSNMGNQYANITRALAGLEQRGIHVVNCSTLYISKPMYFTEQPDFVNGAVKVETKLNPRELLKELKEIEYSVLGRVKEFDNGPRVIDLDILLYDSLILDEKDLKIPHIGMVERPFVLAPLCELTDAVHPVTAEPLRDHLEQISTADLTSTVPLPRLCRGSLEGLRFDLFKGTGMTYVMGILNVTPDSFSDGGSYTALDAAMLRVDEMHDAGVEIIDIGGCSTRPGSEQPSEAEEVARVVPIVESIRSHSKYDAMAISIDTYRAAVAEAALNAGADIINDVSGGLFDAEMYGVVARTGAPYMVGHLRGDIATMAKLNQYDDLIGETCLELANLVSKAIASGVRRWQIILDPGLGFSKDSKQNLEIIRRTRVIKSYEGDVSFKRLPLLLGPSRKRFIGEITGVPVAKERVAGSVAAAVACVSYGADIVRVHDYRETKQACAMADSLFRFN